MSDLLVRDIDDDLKQWIADRSKASGRSLSAEVRDLLRAAKERDVSGRAFVRDLLALVDEKYKGDDLVFEFPHPLRDPPDLG